MKTNNVHSIINIASVAMFGNKKIVQWKKGSCKWWEMRRTKKSEGLGADFASIRSALFSSDDSLDLVHP